MKGVIVVAESLARSKSSGEWSSLIETSDVVAEEVAAATTGCDIWTITCSGFSGSVMVVGVLCSEVFCIDPIFRSCVGVDKGKSDASNGWAVMIGSVGANEADFAPPRRCELWK